MSESSLRTANLLGAVAVATLDRIRRATEGATGRPASDTAALVILTTALSGAAQESLAPVLGLSQSGVVRLVDRLARDGLVERRPGPDGRTVAVVPTAEGHRLAERALDERRHALAQVLGALDDGQRERLAALLEELLGGLTRGRADAVRTCRLCDPWACGHDVGTCPVTRAADAAERSPDRR